MSEIRSGAVRTGTPLLVGYVASVVSRNLLDVNDDNAAALITAGAAYAYYAVARAGEVLLSPKWGYILGSSKTPVYTTPPAAGVDAEGEFTVGDEGVDRVQ